MSDELIEKEGNPSQAEAEVSAPTRKEIGKDLRAAREAAGLSAVQARKLLGVDDVKKVYRYEAGERIPGLQMTIQMAQVYDCSLAELCPCLWHYQADLIADRRHKLADWRKNPGFRNAPRGRRANWELEPQSQGMAAPRKVAHGDLLRGQDLREQ